MQSLISQFFLPEHDYATMILQILGITILYSMYKEFYVKPMRKRAYKLITEDKPLLTYEGSQLHKEKIKQEQDLEDKKQKKINEEQRKLIQIEEEKQREEELLKQQRAQLGSKKELMKKAKQQQKITSTNKQQQRIVSHPLFWSAIKGFSGSITDFSFNEKYIAVASLDKTIKVFPIQQFAQKQAETQFMFHKLETRYASALCICNRDNRIFYACQNQINQLSFNPKAEDRHFFKLEKTFPEQCHKENTTNLFINQNDNYLITTGDDTTIKIWSLRGELLKKIDTAYGQHYHSAWNNHRNFLVLSSWSCDTSVKKYEYISKIFEIKENKDHSFKSIEKVILLRGDKGKALDVQLDQHGVIASLVSDQLTKFFKIDVDFIKREEAKVLKVFQIQEVQKELNLNEQTYAMNSGSSFYSVSTKKSVYCLGISNILAIYDNDFNLNQQIPFAGGEGIITKIVIKEFNHHDQPILLCFVQGEQEDRVNIFNLSKLVY